MNYEEIIYPCGHEEVVQIPENITDIEGHINNLICMKCAQDPSVKRRYMNRDGVLIDKYTGERAVARIKGSEGFLN